MTVSNPARRLHNVLAAFGKQHPSTRVSTAWAQVLDVPDNDVFALGLALSAVAGLPDQIKRLLRNHPGINEALYLQWEEPVRKTLRTSLVNMGLQVGQVRDEKEQELALVYLQFTAEALRTHDRPTPDEDAVSQLIVELQSFESDVSEADELPDDLRTFLLDHAEAMRRALLTVRVRGADCVDEAIERAVGGLILAGVPPVTLRQTDLGERFWTIIMRATALVTLPTVSLDLVKKLAELPGVG